MKLTLETRSANFIYSYEAGLLKIRQNAEKSSRDSDQNRLDQLLNVTDSLILTPEILIQNWLENSKELTVSDIKRVLETQPEVIILGTGENMVIPGNQVMSECYQSGVGIEVMNSAAACRTYNVLASERRKVAVALTVV